MTEFISIIVENNQKTSRDDYYSAESTFCEQNLLFTNGNRFLKADSAFL